MTPKTAFEHLKIILDYGPRPIGSPANQAVANHIRNTFASLELQVEEQPYPCTHWQHERTTLERAGEILTCAANPFSLPCDVTAPIVCAGSLAELETATAHDRILLLHGDLARAPIAPKSWFLKEERDEHLANLLETLQPAAVLAPPTATDYYGTLTEDWELDIAAATIPDDVALKLFHHPHTLVHLEIVAWRTPASARNIVARTEGNKSKRLVICAHFDTKINTPGAMDNGGGVACLLALSEHLKTADLPFELEFVAFNGEEYLPMGDDEYVHRAEGYWNNILAAINLDGVGLALGSTSITLMSAPEEIENRVKAVAAQFPGVVWVAPWPESNHSTFAFRGIPATAISSEGERRVAHHPHDDIKHASQARLEEAIKLVEAMVGVF